MNWHLALAVLLPFLALLLQWLLWPWLYPFVWFLFYPAVFLSARLAALKGGLISTVLSAAIVWYFFMQPQLSWTLDSPYRLYSIGLFLIMGYLFSATHERLRLAQQQIEANLINVRQASQTELQRYEQIVATSSDMLAFVDKEQRYHVVNPAYAGLFGKTPDDLRQRHVADMLDPDLYSFITPYLNRALTGEIQRFTVKLTLNGKLQIMDVEYRPFRQSGEVQGVVVNLRDVTERKQAEEELQESKLKLETALANMTDAVFISDSEGHFTHVNDAFSSFHKFSNKNEGAKNFAEYADLFDVFLDDGTPAPLEQWAIPRALRGETAASTEYTLRRKDTNEIWMGSYSFAPIRNLDATIVGSVVTARDITARKQADEILRKTQERLLLALDASRDGLWDWDLRTGVVFRSHRYYEIVGRDSEEDKSDFDFFKSTVHPDDLGHALATIEAHKQGKTPAIEFDYRLFNPSGKTTWLMAKGRVVERDANGTALRIVGTISDITERKQTEEEIRHLNADLERRVNERTAELTSANLELDAFAYAVSHDLRAPLRAMSGFSQALLEDCGEQLQGEAGVYLDQINLASRKMSELIDGLLVLSRSTRGELQRDTIDLSLLAQNLAAELERSDPERRVAVQVESGLQAQGDARMIEAVLRNLLENAWKYTAHTTAPYIHVYGEKRDGLHYFCVADNGAGFDMAHSNRLFRPFQRLHRQDEFPGIGIGLATVQRIVNRHGGVIEAHGETGKGAVFCFTLGS